MSKYKNLPFGRESISVLVYHIRKIFE